ncbi:MAG TPA: hypothetical protein GXZ77_04390 [Papillibacter sp.]|jgi:hypothetical protein|nr:hypothetical protein [Papillibacter sp.]
MPRKKLKIIPGRRPPNCFAFYWDKGGNPQCSALSDVYCLKEYTPCSFQKTPKEATAARRAAAIRLAQRGMLSF